jgi:hypothetical protein
MSRLLTRLPHVLALWACAALGEAVLYYFFLSRPYFREFVAPFAVGLLVAAAVAAWQMLRPRQKGDRRVHERRVSARRGMQHGAGE